MLPVFCAQLCFGTVLAVGSPEQVESMSTVQANGLLGCFALTEKLAGVQSGLIVQTLAFSKLGVHILFIHMLSSSCRSSMLPVCHEMDLCGDK